ncbi:thymidine phosphorylase [Striga asiatica]|uniref:Thymidine phosphorylase n=1 Tax=Striga asiatica TaxID=4170 RepID=A0A5A7PTP1_STRAF|nr:thymidine phosphorylase [Striga asiatica]
MPAVGTDSHYQCNLPHPTRHHTSPTTSFSLDQTLHYFLPSAQFSAILHSTPLQSANHNRHHPPSSSTDYNQISATSRGGTVEVENCSKIGAGKQIPKIRRQLEIDHPSSISTALL